MFVAHLNVLDVLYNEKNSQSFLEDAERSF